MKKTYICPNQRVVELDSVDMLLSQSDTKTMSLFDDNETAVSTEEDVFARETKNLWDTEW